MSFKSLCAYTCVRAPFHDGTPAEEFMAMTFVHGPEEAIFRDDRPARLRFFMGFADEFACSETPDEARIETTSPPQLFEGFAALVLFPRSSS